MFPPETKILIVDDFSTMRMIVRKVLTELMFINIHEADDGATAWPMLEHAATAGKPFQLVISDLNMPKMKGTELLAGIRDNDSMKSTPFILVIAQTDQKNLRADVSSAVSGYIVRPFSAQVLKDKLENVHKSYTLSMAA